MTELSELEQAIQGLLEQAVYVCDLAVATSQSGEASGEAAPQEKEALKILDDWLIKGEYND